MPNDGDTSARPPRRAFDGLAHAYARARPSYPDAVIEAVLAAIAPEHDAPSRTIVDVGCGTGISTRAIAARATNATVIGVDPNAEMLDEARRHPRAGGAPITWLPGAAEALPVSNASVALITCFQSFHWFEVPRAIAAFARALRPGGAVALVWNERDPSDPVSRAYDSLLDSLPGAHAIRGSALRRDPGATFRKEPAWRTVDGGWFPHSQRLAPGGLRERACSASYFPRTGPERRDALRAIDSIERRFGDERGCEMALRARVTIARPCA